MTSFNAKKTFLPCQHEFEIVNSYVMEMCSDFDKAFLGIYFSKTNNSVELSLYLDSSIIGSDVNSTEDVDNALITIKENAFSQDFSFINVTKERISYGGEGNFMYVYTIDGQKPTYFYSKDSDVASFKTIHLKGNWYLLVNRAR